MHHLSEDFLIVILDEPVVASAKQGNMAIVLSIGSVDLGDSEPVY